MNWRMEIVDRFVNVMLIGWNTFRTHVKHVLEYRIETLTHKKLFQVEHVKY